MHKGTESRRTYVRTYARRDTRLVPADVSKLDERSLTGTTTRSQTRENSANGILIASDVVPRSLKISLLVDLVIRVSKINFHYVYVSVSLFCLFVFF